MRTGREGRRQSLGTTGNNNKRDGCCAGELREERNEVVRVPDPEFSVKPVSKTSQNFSEF